MEEIYTQIKLMRVGRQLLTEGQSSYSYGMCGDSWKNKISEARECFIKSGYDSGLTKIHDWYLEEGLAKELNEFCLRMDQAPLTIEQLIHMGNQQLDKFESVNDGEEKHIKNAIESFEIARYTEGLIKAGDKALEKGKGYFFIDSAICAYEKAGHKEGLIQIGNKALEEAPKNFHLWLYAIRAYEKAGHKEGLIKTGDKALKQEEKEVCMYISDAIWAYEKASHKEGLIKAGDKALKQGWLRESIWAYEKAGQQIPLEKLIQAYNKLLEKGDLSDDVVRKVYEKAGYKDNEGLIKAGDRFLNKIDYDGPEKWRRSRWLDRAIRAYIFADHKEGLIKAGDKGLEQGWFRESIWAYEKAGHKEGLIQIGNKALDQLLSRKDKCAGFDCCYECKDLITLTEWAFLSAGYTEGLIKAGQRYTDKLWLEEAIKVYEKAGHKEGIIEIGRWYEQLHDLGTTLCQVEGAPKNIEKNCAHLLYCAVKAFEKVDYKEGLIGLGKRVFLKKKKQLNKALDAFEKADYHLTPEQLIQIGNEFLLLGLLDEATTAYEKAGRTGRIDISRFLN